MKFSYPSDKIRYDMIVNALEKTGVAPNNNIEQETPRASDDENLTSVTAIKDSDGNVEVRYSELWNEKCLNALFKKPEYESLKDRPLTAIKKFLTERFNKIADQLGLKITNFDIYESGYDGEAVLEVEMMKYNNPSNVDEIINEVDYIENNPKNDPRYNINPSNSRPNPDMQQKVLPQGGVTNIEAPSDNKFNQVYVTRNRPQDPKVVDLLIKTIFDEKFNSKYTLSTDVGEWHPVKTLRTDEGKLLIQWDHAETNKIHIQTVFFAKETNKIDVKVNSTVGESLISTNFEVYRIPTDKFLAERFFRKVYFSVLKKFINTQVIKLEPFRRSFVFWKSDNPHFNYSFSEPRKNQIVLDLIGFIKTAKKPILDDFFEQNNLRHKQGYLQTLLDAAEDAGIFEFSRQGNEVLIVKGANFKSFLEGRIRKY